MAKQPSKPTKNGVLAFAGNAAKFALQGAVVYLAVTALQGQQGKNRLKEDFHAVAVSQSAQCCYACTGYPHTCCLASWAAVTIHSLLL